MRRSVRIYQMAQPRVPLEVQAAIAREAGNNLVATKEGKRRMSELCLVSREWRNEIQAILFRRVPAFNSHNRPLWDLLRSHPHLGKLVKEIDLQYCEEASIAFLGRLSLFPALKVVENPRLHENWGSVDVVPPAGVRPVLRKLSVHDWEAADLPVDWFDLSSLRELYLLSQYPILGTATLTALPSTLEVLHLDHFPLDDLGLVLDHLARFKSLTSLRFTPFAWDDDQNPIASSRSLPTFAKLRTLAVDLDRLPHALSTRQPCVQTIALCSQSIEYGLRGNFTSQVRTICRIVAEDPDRFPALRAVGSCSIDFRWRRHWPKNEEMFAVFGPMVQELAAVGLRLVDGNGVEWRMKWRSQGAVAG